MKHLLQKLFLLTFLAIAITQGSAQEQNESNKSPSVTNSAATNAEPAMAEDRDEVEYRPRRHHWRRRSETVSTGDVTVRGDSTNNNLVVIRGNASVDGAVENHAVVVFGNARVSGKIGENLVVILGSATLSNTADVGGNVVVIGGKLNADKAAKIGGDIVELDPGRIPGLAFATAWITKGLLLGRPLPHQVAGAWIIAGLFLLIHILFLLMFPRPIQACVDSVEAQPIATFFVGVLAKILIPCLFLIVIMTGVGIVVLPFLICALLVGYIFGKISIYRYVGQQLAGRGVSHAGVAPVLALILGTLVFYLLYTVPFLGFLVWGMVSVFGLGAVVMGMFSRFRRERPAALASPVAGAPIPVPLSANPVSTGTTPLHATAGAVPPPTANDPAQGIIPPLPSASTGSGPIPPLEVALMPRAGFWIRFAATLLDWFLLLVVVKFIGPFVFPLALAYHVAMWTWKGTTVGGIIFGLKLVRLDGRPVDFAVALVRSLASIFSAMIAFIGFFWAGWSRDKQSWHDKIAGTVVVKVPKGTSLI